ncbi:MAG: ATP-binding protein [Pirellulales bacterium]
MKDSLYKTLRQLRLSGLAATLEVRLQEAASHNLSHVEFLELILQDELTVRDDRMINRRVNPASFRELKPLDQFDWSFNPSLPKKQVFDLATCRFVRKHRDVLVMGPPGIPQAPEPPDAVLFKEAAEPGSSFRHVRGVLQLLLADATQGQQWQETPNGLYDGWTGGARLEL